VQFGALIEPISMRHRGFSGALLSTPTHITLARDGEKNVKELAFIFGSFLGVRVVLGRGNNEGADGQFRID
jgi:hypothetical protein